MAPTDPLCPISGQKANYAIIVAGGSGTRMGVAVPKQFLLLHGLPVLMHTIKVFHSLITPPVIVVVLPTAYHEYWRTLCIAHSFEMPHQLVNGGESRFHSVKNALDTIADQPGTLIAIHDAVRPLVSREIIELSYQHAAENTNAVTAVKSRDSVRLSENGTSKSLIRDDVYLVQTPQTFMASQIKAAYSQPYHQKFTDDASIVEETGIKINLIAGSYQNIKITFAEDIAIAEAIMKIGL